MKLILIGDFHGTFKGIKQEHLKGCDAILSCGDFCNGDEYRKYAFQAIEWNKTHDAKKKWYEIAGKTQAKKVIKTAMHTGRKVLEGLDNLGLPVLVVPGNTDFAEEQNVAWKFLRINHFKEILKGLKNTTLVHNIHRKMSPFQVIGYGINSSPEIPQTKEDEKRYTAEALAKKLKKYKAQLKRTAALFEKSDFPVIFLSHNVPYDTELDQITWKESPQYGKHFGSLVARKLIEQYHHKILFFVGGHMHEHFAKTKLAGVTCINSGAGYEGKYVVVELDKNKIKHIDFIA